MTKRSNLKCALFAKKALVPMDDKLVIRILSDIEGQILSTEAVRHVVSWPAGDAIGDRIRELTIDQIQNPV